MSRKEIGAQRTLELREKVKRMTGQELINWLGNNINTWYPEIYKDFLPPDLEFISNALGFNCIDFATGCHGRNWLNVSFLTESKGKEGDLIVYQAKNLHALHAGIVIESGKIISQWGQDGAIFKHHPNQIPTNFRGDCFKFYLMPDSSNVKAFSYR